MIYIDTAMIQLSYDSQKDYSNFHFHTLLKKLETS